MTNSFLSYRTNYFLTEDLRSLISVYCTISNSQAIKRLEPQLSLIILELTHWIDQLDGLDELENIGELINNVLWVGVIHSFQSMLMITILSMQHRHFFKDFWKLKLWLGS